MKRIDQNDMRVGKLDDLRGHIFMARSSASEMEIWSLPCQPAKKRKAERPLTVQQANRQRWPHRWLQRLNQAVKAA
jgi:hypothetical protein